MLSRLASLYRVFVFNFIRWSRGGPAAARYLGVTVGEGCRIYSKSFGSEPWLVRIGDRVTVTAGVVFITHDGSGWLVRDEKGRRFRYAPVWIGDDVFIGVNSILMPGVRIGNRVVVAAGSVVTKSVPDGTVVAGSPARIIMRYDDFEQRVRAQWATPEQMRGATFRDQVDSVLERVYKPEMK